MNRTELNDLMKANDPFFEQFSAMDDEVYADGAIPKRYKELTGLSISIATRCD
ncbi:carboxymuconolactone decarboxylase family protein [Weissella confusa]|nr:carboxymuconolactone decarboxylase family protein [Weissella confusa]